MVGTLLVDPESSVRNLAMTCLVSLYDVFGENMLEELMDNTALGSPHIRAVQEAISYRNTHTRGTDSIIDNNNTGKHGVEWSRIDDNRNTDNRNTDLRNTDFDCDTSGSPMSVPQSSSQKSGFSKTRDSTGVGVKRGQPGGRLSSTGETQSMKKSLSCQRLSISLFSVVNLAICFLVCLSECVRCSVQRSWDRLSAIWQT